jgi:hypothetical protein
MRTLFRPLLFTCITLFTGLALSANLAAQPDPCVMPDLIDSTIACPLAFIPVCGCDGVTYGNACEANNYGGLAGWTNGVCGTSTECVDLGGVDFGSCDMVMGVALINGTCMEISGCGWQVALMDYEPYSFASMAGCTPCEDEDPVIDPCTDLAGKMFGICSMVLGFANMNGTCVPVSGCSTTAADGIDYAAAFHPDLASCQAACCGATGTSGCTYPVACNFDPAATQDNGSCVFPPFGCDLPFSGCTYENAINFWWQALWDDGSCIFETGGLCVGDLDGDDFVGVSDVLLLLGTFGNPCPVE